MSNANSRFICFATPACLRPNTTYTLSSNLEIYTIWYRQYGVANISKNAVNGKTSVTFTTPENCDTLCISLNNTSGAADTVAFKWAQIELGAEATAYEPHQGNTFTLDLGQTVYGGSLDWKTGVLTVDWYTKTFDGTENINLQGSAADAYRNYRFVYGNPDRYSKDYKLEAYCSHYPHDTTVYKESSDEIGFIAFGPNIYIRLGSASTITTADAFKAFLAEQYAAGTPVQVCYQLATPITVQLTPTEILALSGQNTLYSDTGDTTVTGRADLPALLQSLTAAQ